MNDKGEQRELTDEEVKELLETRPQLAAYMSNPDTIPPEALASMENDTW